MSHVAGELLFPLQAGLDRIQQAVKSLGQSVDLIPALPQPHPFGKVPLLLNVPHCLGNLCHGTQRPAAEQVSAQRRQQKDQRGQEQGQTQGESEIFLSVADGNDPSQHQISIAFHGEFQIQHVKVRFSGSDGAQFSVGKGQIVGKAVGQLPVEELSVSGIVH